jgi:hypothetical protein
MASCMVAVYLTASAISGVAAAEVRQGGIKPVSAEDPDELYRRRDDISSAKKAADIWATRAAIGKDYEAAWKLARTCYFLGTAGPEAERHAALDRGIVAGRQAAALEPAKPEGHFWYAATMGGMAETGKLVGLKYKNDIKAELERVIAISPGWQAGSAESALGQWYVKVPNNLFCWCGGDDKKGIEWLRKALTYDPDGPQVKYALAEALADDKKTLAEAKTLLQQVIATAIDPDWAPEYRQFQAKAAALLKKLTKK